SLAVAQEAALDVAARLGDLAARGRIHQQLAWLRLLLGDVASAGRHLDEAGALAGQLGDLRFCALVSLTRAHLLHAQDHIREAIAEARKALRLYHAASDRYGQAH